MGQHVPPPPLAQRQRSLSSIVPHSYETFTLLPDCPVGLSAARISVAGTHSVLRMVTKYLYTDTTPRE